MPENDLEKVFSGARKPFWRRPGRFEVHFDGFEASFTHQIGLQANQGGRNQL